MTDSNEFSVYCIKFLISISKCLVTVLPTQGQVSFNRKKDFLKLKIWFWLLKNGDLNDFKEIIFNFRKYVII